MALHHSHCHSGQHGLTISAWLTGLYFIVELAIGLWTGSIAVLSDAFHTFSAVGGVLVALIAARLAKRPAELKKTFGWARAEVIGALVNGAFLLVMAIVVIVMGAMRLNAPIELPPGPLLIAAAGGLITELISLALIWRQSRTDLNVRGALWHVIQTFVGSLLIIVTALVIHFTGFLLIDPILGMAFGVILFWASLGIIKEAVHILMEGVPEDIDVSAISNDLCSIEEVADIHHVHVWTLNGQNHVFSAHLKVLQGADNQAILQNAHKLLKEKYNFFFSTLQLESGCLDETGAEAIDVTTALSGSGAPNTS